MWLRCKCGSVLIHRMSKTIHRVNKIRYSNYPICLKCYKLTGIGKRKRGGWLGRLGRYYYESRRIRRENDKRQAVYKKK